ncbi:hypothetical protein WOLCODRAFT_126531 [Wolfiporia cocos MD-104 SS10]|uniref:LysM domain-containing protein n=1 Tax=Wolfiporia cocos (strain MD-104) TaxID=742152 RepID=A0A2H3J202_WOLCO|nr:hypothetical protein WOLCODRAFT_126531 [Wolfiporia cocos MD-104 SS10]
MKRMLSNSDVRQEDSITEADAPITSQTKEERLVLVHEILPKDSLPGVALRYGVSLPDIRRANQLWPSDPIHLRKVLYIPLEKARHSKEVQNAILDIDSPTPSTEQDQSTQDNSNGEASTMSSPAKTKLTIIRVPASQLSFFPPSSTSAALKEPAIRTSKSMTLPRPSNAPSIRSAIPPSLTQSDLPSPTSASTSSPISFNARTLNRSLGSLARVAPVAVQTFIGRLSIDSVSASASTQSEDREQGHELKDVSAASSLTRGAQGENLHSQFETHPRDRGRGSSTLTDTALDTSRSGALVEGVELASLTPHFRHDPAGHAYRPSILPITSTAQRVPPSTRSNHASGAYTASESSPNPAKTVVRTAQPAPIPVMQLPLPSKRPKSRES